MDVESNDLIAIAQEKKIHVEKLSKFSIESFEQEQRENLIELKMRREQLKTIRVELDEEKLKSNQLKNALETSNNTTKELENNMQILAETKKNCEDKLKEFHDKNKTTLQYDFIVSENKTLKEVLEKSELEKCELSRTLDDLKTQHYCHEMYKTDLFNKNAKLKENIAHISKEFKRMENDHKIFVEQVNSMNKFNDCLKSAEFFKEQFEKHKTDTFNLEKELLYYKGKATKFEELIEASSMIPYNTESQFFLEEWRKSVNDSKDQMQAQLEITSNLLINLKNAKEANLRLIQREVALEKQINEMKLLKSVKDVEIQTDVVLDNLNEIKSPELVVIKTETIEIDD